MYKSGFELAFRFESRSKHIFFKHIRFLSHFHFAEAFGSIETKEYGTSIVLDSLFIGKNFNKLNWENFKFSQKREELKFLFHGHALSATHADEALFPSQPFSHALPLSATLSHCTRNVDSLEMESSIVDASAASRKRRRDEEEEEELEQVFFIIVSVVTMLLGALTWYHDKYFVKEHARNLELERHSFLNRLYRGTETDCIEQLRVSKKAFFKLCRILQEKGQLVKTKNVPIDEVVAIFLHILAHNLKYRVVHFSYCRSMETISRQFKNVLRAIMKVSKEYLKFHEYNLESSVENKWRWFKVNNCQYNKLNNYKHIFRYKEENNETPTNWIYSIWKGDKEI
ncbi:hypothetical protein GmHk_18G051950 [Glycine max]|nr:hypothetical protein GmHk_18G051950 [Glycine max]